MAEIHIRNVLQNDMEAVIEVMNHGIEEEANAYEGIFENHEGEQWFMSLFKAARVFLVAEADEKLVGWGTLTPYRSGRGRLDKVLEISFYVHKEFRNQSVATSLIHVLESEARRLQCTHLLGILIDQNQKSINLLSTRGYQQCAHMPDIVRFEKEARGHSFYMKPLKL